MKPRYLLNWKIRLVVHEAYNDLPNSRRVEAFPSVNLEFLARNSETVKSITTIIEEVLVINTPG